MSTYEGSDDLSRGPPLKHGCAALAGLSARSCKSNDREVCDRSRTSYSVERAVPATSPREGEEGALPHAAVRLARSMRAGRRTREHLRVEASLLSVGVRSCVERREDNEVVTNRCRFETEVAHLSYSAKSGARNLRGAAALPLYV